MVAVSDTSPISNLALIGRLDLLRIQFDRVWIPDAVKGELDRVPNRDAMASIEQAVQQGCSVAAAPATSNWWTR
jgi:predicted nucleic acid-binding protein